MIGQLWPAAPANADRWSMQLPRHEQAAVVTSTILILGALLSFGADRNDFALLFSGLLSVQLGVILLVAAAGLAFWQFGDRNSDDTHKVSDKISTVQLAAGHSDITIRVSDDSQTTVREKRKYWFFNHGNAYSVHDGVLKLDGDCGWRCTADYEVTVPRGTKVTGENGRILVIVPSDLPVRLKGAIKVAGGQITGDHGEPSGQRCSHHAKKPMRRSASVSATNARSR